MVDLLENSAHCAARYLLAQDMAGHGRLHCIRSISCITKGFGHMRLHCAQILWMDHEFLDARVHVHMDMMMTIMMVHIACV